MSAVCQEINVGDDGAAVPKPPSLPAEGTPLPVGQDGRSVLVQSPFHGVGRNIGQLGQNGVSAITSLLERVGATDRARHGHGLRFGHPMATKEP